MAEPEVITRQKLASTAAARWDELYGIVDGRYRNPIVFQPERLLISVALHNLGPAPDPDEVDRVIGNGSWTSVPSCNGCSETAAAVVRVGEEPDYESATARLCRTCLREALALIEAKEDG